MTPRLSIVIPFFNEEECIEEVCLEAKQVASKLLPNNWEMIMVDDGSTDRTAGLVERKFAGRLALWRRRFRENAFWWVLYGRLIPFSNATLTSLLSGSCRVPLAQYLLASLIGFMPLNLVFAAFGSGGVKGDFDQLLMGTGLLLAAIAARSLFNYRQSLSRAEAQALSTAAVSSGHGKN